LKRRESVRQPAIPKGIDAARCREQTPEIEVKSRRGTAGRKIRTGLAEPEDPEARQKRKGVRRLETGWRGSSGSKTLKGG
jgi:hypothetical protein